MAKKMICYVDTETTGLSDEHEPWEVAAMVLDGVGGDLVSELRFTLPPENFASADPVALVVGKFWARGGRTLINVEPHNIDVSNIATLQEMLSGNTLAGLSPDFDVRMLDKMYTRFGFPVRPHHYKLLDVGTYATGVAHMAGLVEWDSFPNTGSLFEIFGVKSDDDARHTAMGDVKATAALHLAAVQMGRSLQKEVG